MYKDKYSNVIRSACIFCLIASHAQAQSLTVGNPSELPIYRAPSVSVPVGPGERTAPAERRTVKGTGMQTLSTTQRPLGEAPRASGDARVQRIGNEAVTTLDVQYAFFRIYNPFTTSSDTVRLRSYNGSITDPQASDEAFKNAAPVGPTIRLNPSETVRITLNNRLPIDPCVQQSGNHNTPNCFNFTNLHGHGLHVSPMGNSDNVHLEIRPQESFQYEYNIAAGHPAGTFWYHAHRHGSTALQVSSGMAGALIINGTRDPDSATDDKGRTTLVPGDVDRILMIPGADGKPEPFPERILLFEQIQYACREPGGSIQRTTPSDARSTWSCLPTPQVPNPVGGIEGYDQFGPGSWSTSGRYTLVNGRLQPQLSLDGDDKPSKPAVAGRPERWRMIHGGVRETIKLAIYKATAPVPAEASFASVSERNRFTADHCNGALVTQWVIAQDGLTRERVLPLTSVPYQGRTLTVPNVLQPGYRSDALVIFPDEGDYCVLDEAAPANASVSQTPKDRRLLATVHVDPAPTVGTAVTADAAGLARALVRGAEATMPPTVKQTVVDDLNDGLKLSLFVPHRTIASSEVTGKQSVVFSIDQTSPSPSDPQTRFGINHEAYNPAKVRHLTLGGVDEWELTSQRAAHPFHIHVNPFQIDRIEKEVSVQEGGNSIMKTVDLTDPSIDFATRLAYEADTSGNSPDTEYLNLKGVWKDTLFVKQGYRVYVRSRYERYIGDFVLHCHILDHEDQGMMENVRISLPRERPAHQSSGHGGH